MAEIIKIALLGITGVLFAIQFRQQRPEYALLIGFALSILVFSFVCRMAGNLLEEFRGLQQYLGDSKGYLGILMKVVGITYLCDGPILKNSVSIFFTVFIDLWYNQSKRLNKGDYPGRK